MSEKYSAEWWRKYANISPRRLNREDADALAAREKAHAEEVKRLREALDQIVSYSELPACDYPGASKVVLIARAALEDTR